MILTKQELIKLNACTDGIKEFDKLFPKGFNLKNWTLEKQIEIIKSPLRSYFGWAVDKKIIPLWNMSGSDLSGCDLSGSDLRESNLYGSNLRGSDLSGSDLRGCDLRGCDLRGCNLNMVEIDKKYFDYIKRQNVVNFDKIIWVE